MCRKLIYPTLLMLVLGATVVQAQELNWIRAAWWDGRYPTNWADEASTVAVRDGVVAAGYELLNSDQLKTWMNARIADKKLSVVVFCRDIAPDTVIESMSSGCTLRKYLDAGGKIVFYADIPFYNQGHADGTMTNWAEAGATAILGIGTVSVWDTNTQTVITPMGLRWGLTQTWASVRPYATTGLTVLATDGPGNAAAWVKFYVPGDSYRGFVRLWDRGGYPPVADIIRVAEYIGLKAGAPNPADGAIGVAMPLLTWQPGGFALFHNVYFGTTPDLTEANLVASHQLFAMYYHIPGLQSGTTYYWRVDEVEASGTIRTGDLWHFMSEPVKAYAPTPADGATGLLPGMNLTWLKGKAATGQHVFFGTDQAAVANGAASVDKGTSPDTTFNTGALRASTTYYWRADTVKGDGTSVSGDVWSFSTADAGPANKIKYEWWLNIGGTNVSALTGNANYPSNPDGSEYVDTFQSRVDWADNYGQRLWGWLKPEQTGDYTFWIAGDDEQQLWLSTDGSPTNAVRIANVSGWTPALDFDNTGGGAGGAGQKSAAIKLEAGQKYFIMALGKEGGGGDSTAVAWQGPGIAARQVIPAKYVDMFYLAPLQAFGPTPANGAVDTAQSLTLSWTAGDKAQKHEVYFGTDKDAVAAADNTSPLFVGSQTGTSYDTGDLEWGKTYYWRVDETNAGEADSPWKGTVWSFTTANFIPVDNMESYTDDEGSRIYETWVDGWTNGTGSVVGNLVAPFAERTIVHDGKQAMPMDYNNAKTPFYSEAEQEFSPLQNWTVNGVTDLSLWVRGYPAVTSVAVAEAAGKISLTGDGSDIWNNSDEFVYAYKSLNSNGSMVARVVSIGPGTNTWAKAGVMIRDSLNGGSTFVNMVMTANSDGAAGNGASFQYRLAADGGCANTDSTSVVKPPYWVKIERTGDNISGSYSADGKTWRSVGTPQTITMSAPVYIGLCVTSHASGEQRTFEFDSITTTGGVAGQWQGAQIASPRYNDVASLYVAVEDSAGKVAVASDPALVNAAAWTEWKVPLSSLTGVNLAKVKKLYIGVGDRNNPAAGGSGRIYIDDIRVTKP